MNCALNGADTGTTFHVERGQKMIPPATRGDGKRNSFPPTASTQEIPLSPLYHTIMRAQERNRHVPLKSFPPNMTAQQAALDAIHRARMMAMLIHVKQPPYNVQPASGQSRTFTDATVSATQITLPAVGAYGVVVTFQVPSGRNGIIDALSNQLTVGGFQDGSWKRALVSHGEWHGSSRIQQREGVPWARCRTRWI